MCKVEHVNDLTAQEKETVLSIWNAEYPEKLCMPGIKEFNDYLGTLVNADYMLLKDTDSAVIGWATSFSVGGIRCFFIMLKEAWHGRGYGTQLLNALKTREDALFGWVVDHDNDVKADGRPYLSPINFYRKNDFFVNSDLRLETDVLSAVNIIWRASAP